MRNIKIEFDKKGSTSRVNLDVDQFADNFFEFRVVGAGNTSINLSGHSFTGTIKKHVGASSTAADTISVGILTSGQSSGILTARVVAGVTSNFDKNNARYTYEVIATSGSGYKRKLVNGDVNVNVGITDNAFTIGTNIKCIAVIDESDSGATVSVDSYNSFRSSFPGREHFLLQPTATGIANTSELISSNLQSVYVSGFGTSKQVQGVNRDDGVEADRSDWFAIVGLQTGVDTEVALFVDISGSMTLSTVQESFDLFNERCTTAGIGVRTESNASEDWIEPFTGLLLAN
jgi:hypothetical protein|tara:strand:+ start:71 stop:937 length:867 start_codon:yes stop_codon:yes gene_type:complete